MTLPEPERLVMAIGGRRIHIACRGAPDAPPAILLHGMRDHARSWDWVAEALAADYRVLAPDLRGHGDSDWTAHHGYTLAEFVLDIADLAGALGLERYALVGHSFGGHLSLRHAAIWPEQVTCVSGIECVELPIIREQRENPVPMPVRLRIWQDKLRAVRKLQPRHYATLAEAEARMRAQQADLDPETITHLAAHAVIADADSGWRWKFDNSVRLRPPDDADGTALDEVLAAITCPVQLIYGTASWVPMPPPQRLALLRDLSLVTIPGVSHWLHHQARTRYLTELTAFLAACHDDKEGQPR